MPIRILATFPDTADLKGSSTYKDAPDTTEVQSFSWSLSAYAEHGVTQGARRAENLSIAKQIDGISAILMLYCANGTHIPKVHLDLYHMDRTNKQAIFSKITLFDALVTSVSSSETGHGDTGHETVSFDFAKITIVSFGKTYTDEIRTVTGAVK